MDNPISEYNEELYVFRRLSPRERIEQLTLKLETDDDFVTKFKDDFRKWEQQEELATRQSMDKWLRMNSCAIEDK